MRKLFVCASIAALYLSSCGGGNTKNETGTPNQQAAASDVQTAIATVTNTTDSLKKSSLDLNKKVADLPKEESQSLVEKIITAFEPMAKSSCIMVGIQGKIAGQGRCEDIVSECQKGVKEDFAQKDLLVMQTEEHLKRSSINGQDIVDCLDLFAANMKDSVSKLSCDTDQEQFEALSKSLEKKLDERQKQRLFQCQKWFQPSSDDEAPQMTPPDEDPRAPESPVDYN